jgi:hypothetical protein
MKDNFVQVLFCQDGRIQGCGEEKKMGCAREIFSKL